MKLFLSIILIMIQGNAIAIGQKNSTTQNGLILKAYSKLYYQNYKKSVPTLNYFRKTPGAAKYLAAITDYEMEIVDSFSTTDFNLFSEFKLINNRITFTHRNNKFEILPTSKFTNTFYVNNKKFNFDPEITFHENAAELKKLTKNKSFSLLHLFISDAYAQRHWESNYLAALLIGITLPDLLYADGDFADCVINSYYSKNRKVCEYIAKRNIEKFALQLTEEIRKATKSCEKDIQEVKELKRDFVVDPKEMNDFVLLSTLKTNAAYKSKTATLLESVYLIENNEDQVLRDIKTSLAFHFQVKFKSDSTITGIEKFTCKNLLNHIAWTKDINKNAREDFEKVKWNCISVKELRACVDDYYTELEKAKGTVMETARRNNIKLKIDFGETPQTNSTKNK